MIALTILLIWFIGLMAKWRVFQKMAFNGWKSLIPLYNRYLMFKGVYGNGWVVLKLWLAPAAAALLQLLASAIFRERYESGRYSYSYLSGAGHFVIAAIALVAIIFFVRTLIKLYVDLAHIFGQTTSFAVGLILVNRIFMIILGFSGYVYRDGSYAISESDIISVTAYKLENWLRSRHKDDGKDVITLLKELGELHAQGVIDDETYESKKSELLKRL